MENNENNQQKKKANDLFKKIIIVLLFLSTYVMVFLLGRLTNIGTLGQKDVIPDTTPSTAPSTIKPTDSHTSINIGEQDIELDGMITLWEGNKKWSQLEHLNIFKSNFYGKYYENKVAPGFYGTYNFVLENPSDFAVSYIMSFSEKNDEKINIVYSVQKNGEYILGNVDQKVYIDGVKLEKIIIPAHTKVYYALNWKWEDAENDTLLGTEASAKYELTIAYQAEEV